MVDDPFWGNLFHRRRRGEDQLYDILSEIPIFRDLSRRDFARLEGILHRRSYAPGEAIVTEGDMGVGMYVILSGEVTIVQQGEGESVIKLATFGPGDFFGDQVLLDESPRTASAIAQEACHAIGFFRPDLLELIEHNPRLGLKIVMRLSQMISVRLRQTNRLLKEARALARKAGEEAERAHSSLAQEMEGGNARDGDKVAAVAPELSASLPTSGAPPS
jgi:CRP-like cAMP-binding protein